jgi:high-affinity nickel permease
LSVGFFSALGHSTIVFALGSSLAVCGLGGAVTNRCSILHEASGLVGLACRARSCS